MHFRISKNKNRKKSNVVIPAFMSRIQLIKILSPVWRKRLNSGWEESRDDINFPLLPWSTYQRKTKSENPYILMEISKRTFTIKLTWLENWSMYRRKRMWSSLRSQSSTRELKSQYFSARAATDSYCSLFTVKSCIKRHCQ